MRTFTCGNGGLRPWMQTGTAACPWDTYWHHTPQMPKSSSWITPINPVLSPHNFPSYQSQHSIIPLSILALNLALKNHALCFCFWLVLCVIMILVLSLSCQGPPWVRVPGFNSFIQLTLHGGGRPRQGVRVSCVRDAINESLGLLMWKVFPCYFRLLLRQVWDSVMSYF